MCTKLEFLPMICLYLFEILSLREYYSRKTRADGTTYWQGGKNLPETAVWPWAFCRGLLLRWEDQVRGSLGRRALHNQVPDADMILISDAEDE